MSDREPYERDRTYKGTIKKIHMKPFDRSGSKKVFFEISVRWYCCRNLCSLIGSNSQGGRLCENCGQFCRFLQQSDDIAGSPLAYGFFIWKDFGVNHKHKHGMGVSGGELASHAFVIYFS